MDKSLLKDAMDTVSPALSSKDFIPIFKCLCFGEEEVYAYDDLVAIRKKLKSGIRGAVRGTVLSSIVNSLDSETVTIQQNDTEVTLKSGKMKLDFPVIPEEDFIFEWPEEFQSNIEVKIDDELISAIKNCMLSCTVDTSTPSICGITLATDGDGNLTLNSTDRESLTSITMGPHDLSHPVMLPLDYCHAIVQTKDRVDSEGLLMVEESGRFSIAEFDGVEIFTRLSSAKPIDFEAELNKHLSKAEDIFSIPEKAETVLSRAATLVSGENGICTLSVDSGGMHLKTRSSYGVLEDDLEFPCDHKEISVSVVPERLLKAVSREGIDSMSITNVAIIFSGDNHIHIVGNDPSND